MEQKLMEENSKESGRTEAPSCEFVRAVAQLLETDPKDILSELGYTYPEEESILHPPYEFSKRVE